MQVKRRRASDPATCDKIENVSCSTHESSGQCFFWAVRRHQSNSVLRSRLKLSLSSHVLLDVKQGDDTFRPERAKRRHARPHELDSDDDDDDDEGNENALQAEETSDKVEASLPAYDAPQISVMKFRFVI